MDWYSDWLMWSFDANVILGFLLIFCGVILQVCLCFPVQCFPFPFALCTQLQTSQCALSDSLLLLPNSYGPIPGPTPLGSCESRADMVSSVTSQGSYVQTQWAEGRNSHPFFSVRRLSVYSSIFSLISRASVKHGDRIYARKYEEKVNVLGARERKFLHMEGGVFPRSSHAFRVFLGLGGCKQNHKLSVLARTRGQMEFKSFSVFS